MRWSPITNGERPGLNWKTPLCADWEEDEIETGMNPLGRMHRYVPGEWDELTYFDVQVCEFIDYWAEQRRSRLEAEGRRRAWHPTTRPRLYHDIGRCAACDEPVKASGAGFSGEPCWPGGVLYHHACAPKQPDARPDGPNPTRSGSVVGTYEEGI
jgi:hypothetical protein